MGDNHRRSIMKAIIYRGGSIMILGLLSWLTTEDFIQASIITIGYQLISVVGYYVYERLWEKVRWGRRNENR